MHVVAVADELRGHLFAREHRAGKARSPVGDRRHPVEQMRGVPGAGLDRGDRRVEVRAGVPERHAVTGRDQRRDEIDAARQLGRERHDADVGPRRGDDVEDVARRERRRHSQSRPGARRHDDRLRAAVVGVDEVAFEMRGQHARTARHSGDARVADLVQKGAQLVRRTGDGRRTERGDAVARQAREAISATASPPSSVSCPSTPCTCTSMNPGTT